MDGKIYTLPDLNYGYKDLEPHMSEEQLTLHHKKHHQAYVNGANAVFEKLEKARKENANIDMKASLKEFSFHVSGHILHSLFWGNLKPSLKDGRENNPDAKLEKLLISGFGNVERFKKEFSQAAASVEGSGWAVLAFDAMNNKPMIMQIEKHNINVIPSLKVLMVLDVWEHAYYLDYKNERQKFIDAFWNVVDWDGGGGRL